MTRIQAAGMIQAYLARYGLRSEGLNARNLGGLRLGDADLYFVYDPSTQTLTCQALICRSLFAFDDRTLARFKAAVRTHDAGGGCVEYQAENNGLFLVRQYKAVEAAPAFAAAMRRLLIASLEWNRSVIDAYLTPAKS